MKKIVLGLILSISLIFNLYAQKKVPDYVTEALKSYHPRPGTYYTMDEAKRKPSSVIVLNLSQRGLKKVPDGVRRFKNLEVLDLGYNELSELPSWICELKKIKELDIANNKFIKLPDFIFNIGTLETLDCSANEIQNFEIKGDKKLLNQLNLAFNNLTDLPSNFTYLKKLQIIVLTGNRFIFIPKVIGGMSSLKKIDLTNNRIIDFDDSIASAQNLELLSLDSNPIEDVKIRELRVLLPNCHVYTGN
jgi:Leucine-rich repeat (LRR) protein